MDRGVAVRSAADGIVFQALDGHPDRNALNLDEPDPDPLPKTNLIRIDHPGDVPHVLLSSQERTRCSSKPGSGSRPGSRSRWWAVPAAPRGRICILKCDVFDVSDPYDIARLAWRSRGDARKNRSGGGKRRCPTPGRCPACWTTASRREQPNEEDIRKTVRRKRRRSRARGLRVWRRRPHRLDLVATLWNRGGRQTDDIAFSTPTETPLLSTNSPRRQFASATGSAQ